VNSGFEIKADSKSNKTSVSLLQQDYDDIRFHLNKLNYPSRIKRVQIHLEEVIFDDGTVWRSGSWFKVDPANPNKLIENEGDDNIALSSLGDECVRVTYFYDDCIRTPNFICTVKIASLSSTKHLTKYFAV